MTHAATFNSLAVEIRLQIWRLLYHSQEPRIVEVRTAKQRDNDTQHENRWHIRYSPSPPPVVVNVCREAREEAEVVAKAGGHLLFSADQRNESSHIYFNPEKDTLYIHNDKDYWVRDWHGGVGIMTQLKHNWQPERLHLLAIELDPIHRATSRASFRDDLTCLQGLDHVIFVVAQSNEKTKELARQLSRVPKSMRREVEWLRDNGFTFDNAGYVEIRGSKQLFPGSGLKQCSLAIRRGTRFEIIVSYQDDML
jgi:hypothetical protein